MRPSAIQFVFNPRVSLQEAEMSLHLAMFAVEGLIGRVRVCLDANYHLDESKRAIVIATRRHAGTADCARLYRTANAGVR